MKDYVVEVLYNNRNEFSDTFLSYEQALSYALTMSVLARVSETRIYYGDDIIEEYVDGKWVDHNPPMVWYNIDADY